MGILYYTPKDWIVTYCGTDINALRRFKSNFPELEFYLTRTHIDYTDEQKILLAKYQIVVEQLIKEHKPRKHDPKVHIKLSSEGQDGIFTHFYDFINKYKEELKTRVQILEQPSLPAPVAAAPVATALVATTEEEESDDEDAFGGGGAIKKNKHRTSRNRRKIRKSKSKRKKSKRKKSKRSKSKRKRTKRKSL